MRRRDFITLLGGAAAAWPLVARAQQPRVPVIGYLHSASPEPYSSMMAAFRHGLAEAGYVDGQNVTIDYRWAEGQFDRLPALAAELVAHRPAVLVAGGGDVSAVAAKSAGTVAAHSATAASQSRRRHAAGISSWDPSSLPDWLNAEGFMQKVQPMLANVTRCAMSTALGVSWVYISHIRAGAKRPHPRHWVKLAELVGLVELSGWRSLSGASLAPETDGT